MRWSNRGTSNARTAGWVLADSRKVPVTISQANNGNSVLIEGRINGTPCHRTIDTGASHTLIHFQLLKRLPRDHLPVQERKHRQLLTAAGQYIPVQGEREVAVKLGDKLYWDTVG